MSSHIVLYFVLLASYVIFNIESSIVEFNAPELIRKNELYKLIINNPLPGSKFPVDNFAFTFELLLKLTPRVELSIADVSSVTYTGEEYRGFTIKNFLIMKNSVEMQVEFRREAHGTVFRVRYTSAKTERDKEVFYISKPDTGIILERQINMFLPYTITMQVGPEVREVASSDKEIVGHALLPDKNGQISCQATDGLPNSYPEFINSNILTGATVTAVNNDVTKLTWIVRQQDHGKQIQCRAGQDINNVTLNVYHYMTGIQTIPVIDNKVARDSQIKCISKDGYPTPTTEWIFVSGPKESKRYYELQDNSMTLLINSSVILNSNWTFECRGLNNMPNTVAKYLTTSPPVYPIRHIFNFTIIASISPDVQTASAGLIVVLILLMIIIIGALVFGFINREKIQKFINDNKPGAGQLSKTLPKSTDSGYKYTGVSKVDTQHNGTEKEDATHYSEIVGTVQPKSATNALGPIHRV